jgi:hypothetical protein
MTKTNNAPYTLFTDDGMDRKFDRESDAIKAGYKYQDKGGDCTVEDSKGYKVWNSCQTWTD